MKEADRLSESVLRQGGVALDEKLQWIPVRQRQQRLPGDQCHRNARRGELKRSQFIARDGKTGRQCHGSCVGHFRIGIVARLGEFGAQQEMRHWIGRRIRAGEAKQLDRLLGVVRGARFEGLIEDGAAAPAR